MLSSVVSQITTAMAEGGKVVSKRSARIFTEDEMEGPANNHDNQLSARTMNKQNEEAIALEDRGRKNSTSTSSSSQTSRQTSIEATAMTGERQSTGKEDHHLQGIDTTPFLLGQVAGDGGDLSGTLGTTLSSAQVDESLPKTGRPANFGVVVPGVYRSSFPQTEDHEFISKLKLKTIVTLVQKDFPDGYDAFVRKNGIKHHVFDMRGTKKERIPDKTMKAILGLVLDRSNHPLLIHCNHGKHRTGCVVAVVRILTGWEMGKIVAEYKDYAEPKVRDCDIEYITKFEPSSISTNLFARDANAQVRFQRFALVTIAVLCLWVVSGRSISSVVPADRRIP